MFLNKKNKLIAQITGEITEAGEVTEEKSAEVAKQWMEIADVDESGTIDKKEF